MQLDMLCTHLKNIKHTSRLEGLAQTVHVDARDAGRRRGLLLLEVEGGLQFPSQPLHAVHIG